MLGIAEAVGAITSLTDTVIKRFWPDATAIELEKINQITGEMQSQYSLLLGQLDINKIEAASPSLFKSGWRPAVGWVCVAGLGYVSVIEPVARFVAVVCFAYLGAFPVIDTTITMQILLGLLGLAGMRSFDKLKGVKR